jgi:outer membrane biosynthesis protein TonB
MIPQTTIDEFKRDPLGSVTAMVKDPKSVLKSLKIPDSVKSVMEMVPPGIKDKFLPTTDAEAVESEAEPKREPEREPEPKPEPKPEPEPESKPEPKQERVREPSPARKVLFEPEPSKDIVDVPVLPRTDSHEVVDLGGVIVEEPTKDEIRNPVTLQISADDLAEIQSMLAEKKKLHLVV